MATIFQDSKERAWTLGITFGDVKRVKTLTGHNLARPGRQLPKGSTGEEIINLPEDEQPLYYRLAYDPIVLIDVVFALVEPQAREKGVTDEQFGMAMTPEIFKDVSKKFWEVYYDFFLAAGDQMNAKMIEQVRRARKLMEKEAERISSKIDAAVDKRMEEAIQEIETTIQ